MMMGVCMLGVMTIRDLCGKVVRVSNLPCQQLALLTVRSPEARSRRMG